MVSHEQRRTVRFQKGLFPDIGIRIMDERARLNIPVCVDMAVTPAPGNAASHIFSVIPEVHCKNRLRLPVFPNFVVHHLSLFRRRHQLRHGPFSHRHIGEKPGKFRSHFNHLIKIGLASDHLRICRCITAGDAEGQLPFLQYVHGADDLLIGSISPAGIGGLFKSLYADSRHEILHPEHFFRERFINQRAVCERGKHAVRMLLAQTDDIVLSHQRFSADEQINIGSQLHPLLHDTVHFFIGQVHMVSILRRPASRTLQVTGTGGIQKNRPWNIAVIFLPVLFLSLIAEQASVDDKIFKNPVSHSRIDIRPQAHHQLMPVIILLHNHVADDIPLGLERILPIEAVKPVQKLGKIFLRILIQIRKRLFHCECLYVLYDCHNSCFLSLWFSVF